MQGHVSIDDGSQVAGAGADYLFMSYAAVDREAALFVADAVQAAGLGVWIDSKGLAGGDLWAAEITAAIRGCRALVLLSTAASVRSRNVRQEVQLAWDHEKLIIPILLEDVSFPDELAYFVQGRQWIGARDVSNLEWLRQLAATLGTPASPAHSGPAKPQFIRKVSPQFAGKLVGREQLLHQLTEVLSEDGPTLISLTGPGGVGKTRLALEVGRRLSEQGMVDLVFVDLSTTNDPSSVPAFVARALGIREVPGEESIAQLRSALAPQERLLLILDNFEQVIDAAPFVGDLLTFAPGLRVVVTSRESLRILSEHEIQVRPFDLPSASKRASLSIIEANPAIQIFVEHSSVARPGFALSSENADAVAEICRRLDGLPLAIELAAARVRRFSPDVLLENMNERLPLLTGGRRDQPARQQTLEKTILWSYELLPADEQALLRLMGVFVGGATFEAIRAVAEACSSTQHVELFAALSSLVDKNLVRELDPGAGEPRFVQLEVVREFALKALDLAGDGEAARSAHASHFLLSTESIHLGLIAPFGDLTCFQMIDADIDNYRAAFAWFHAAGNAESCAKLAFRLWGYLYLLGLDREALGYSKAALQLAENQAISSGVRGLLLTIIAHGATVTQESSDGDSIARMALDLLRQEGGPGSDLEIMGIDTLMIVLRDFGEFDEAKELARKMLEFARASGNRLTEAYASYHLGYLHYLAEEVAEAQRALSAAVSGSYDIGAIEVFLYSSRILGQLYVERGDLAAAAPILRDLQEGWQSTGYRSIMGFAVDLVALFAFKIDRQVESATLFGFCETYTNLTGDISLIETWGITTREALRDRMGAEAFDSAFHAGERLSAQEALQLSNEVLGQVDGLAQLDDAELIAGRSPG